MIEFLVWYGAAILLIATTLGVPLVDVLIHDRERDRR